LIVTASVINRDLHSVNYLNCVLSKEAIWLANLCQQELYSLHSSIAVSWYMHWWQVCSGGCIYTTSTIFPRPYSQDDRT